MSKNEKSENRGYRKGEIIILKKVRAYTNIDEKVFLGNKIHKGGSKSEARFITAMECKIGLIYLYKDKENSHVLLLNDLDTAPF